MIESITRVNGVETMVTVSDAAKILGVSPCRVLQFIDDGRIKATKMTPRLYVIDIREVRRFSQIPRKPGRKSQKRA